MRQVEKSLPLVSVVIPVYNHQQYVEQAVNSVLKQSYPNLEIIIIDDGSKDDSTKKVDQCLDAWRKAPAQGLERQITFIKQQNQGAHHTINRGLSLATGDFLTILNSDDYFHLERIKTLVHMTGQVNAQFAFTAVQGVDAESHALPVNHWWRRWYENCKSNLSRMPTVGFLLLQDNLMVSTGNMFFSRELYQEVGPFKNLKLAHDLDFIVRALALTEPVFIREELYFYRMHGTNTQHQVGHLIDSEFREIYRTYLSLVSQKPPKNNMAPCHWYWPQEFGKTRLKLHMDRSLDVYIKNVAVENNLHNIPKKSFFAVPDFFRMQAPQTIGLITDDLGRSDTSASFLGLALSLKRNGYQPSVIALKDGPIHYQLKGAGIPVTVLPAGSIVKKALHGLFQTIFNTKSLTIVNSLESWPLVFFMALCRPFCSIKWLIHEDTAPTGLFNTHISRYLFKWFKSKKTRHFWFSSNSSKKAWKASQLEGEVVYWSGIARQPERRVSAEPLSRLLAVVTPSTFHGMRYLVDAFLACLEEGRIPVNTTLTLIGVPDMNNREFVAFGDLILCLCASRFKENVQLIGAVSCQQLDEYYQNASLFIQPSLAARLSVTMLTAMSKGLPIITTNLEACTEAIQHGYNGIHCQPYDKKSLADAIVEAILNPEKSREMGRKAQETFNERFSVEVTEQHLLNHLKK